MLSLIVACTPRQTAMISVKQLNIIFKKTCYLNELTFAAINATITQGPSNTLSQIGNQVKLNCIANTAIGYWFVSKNGVTADEFIIVGPGCSALNPAFADHYAVESLGGGTTCNLIVFNITMGQAGVYRCLEATSNVLSILTVTGNVVDICECEL